MGIRQLPAAQHFKKLQRDSYFCMAAEGELTQLLGAWRGGDRKAFEHLVDARVDWHDRAHFFAVAARQMRRILVNHALEKKAARRGGGAPHAPLDDALDIIGTASAEISDLDDALQRLERFDAKTAQILELHYFGGLTSQKIGAVVGLSSKTLDVELRFAKAWLRQQLSGPPASSADQPPASETPG